CARRGGGGAEVGLSSRRNGVDQCPLSPHKRRKSGHSFTAAQCQQRSLPPFAERKVMEYSVARRSLGLCARELDYFAPFLGIVSDELAEVGDRAGKYHAPKVGKPRLQLGISEPRIDLAIELTNDLGRCVFGRTEANHWLASKPGTKSPTVGISGSASERIAVVTAKAASLPARMYSSDAAMSVNVTWICPPSRSVIAGPALRYGTCVRLTPVIILKSSPIT